jgi:hypothetical protein
VVILFPLLLHFGLSHFFQESAQLFFFDFATIEYAINDLLISVTMD